MRACVRGARVGGRLRDILVLRMPLHGERLRDVRYGSGRRGMHFARSLAPRNGSLSSHLAVRRILVVHCCSCLVAFEFRRSSSFSVPESVVIVIMSQNSGVVCKHFTPLPVSDSDFDCAYCIRVPIHSDFR
jgi:hypothetical protein